MKRITIYPKDIMLLTGKSERYSREILKQIKLKLNKEKFQIVTISEFCNYMGIDNDEVKNIIK